MSKRFATFSCNRPICIHEAYLESLISLSQLLLRAQKRNLLWLGLMSFLGQQLNSATIVVSATCLLFRLDPSHLQLEIPFLYWSPYYTLLLITASWMYTTSPPPPFSVCSWKEVALTPGALFRRREPTVEFWRQFNIYTVIVIVVSW